MQVPKQQSAFSMQNAPWPLGAQAHVPALQTVEMQSDGSVHDAPGANPIHVHSPSPKRAPHRPWQQSASERQAQAEVPVPSELERHMHTPFAHAPAPAQHLSEQGDPGASRQTLPLSVVFAQSCPLGQVRSGQGGGLLQASPSTKMMQANNHPACTARRQGRTQASSAIARAAATVASKQGTVCRQTCPIQEGVVLIVTPAVEVCGPEVA